MLKNSYVTSKSAPRGRIYDRNGVLIVDNEPVKVIFYKKKNNVTTKEEIEMAIKVADLIDIDYKKMIVLKDNKPIYRIIERYSNKTNKMLLPKLESIGGVEND